MTLLEWEKLVLNVFFQPICGSSYYKDPFRITFRNHDGEYGEYFWPGMIPGIAREYLVTQTKIKTENITHA